jgi:hypothetical protein
MSHKKIIHSPYKSVHNGYPTHFQDLGGEIWANLSHVHQKGNGLQLLTSFKIYLYT